MRICTRLVAILGLLLLQGCKHRSSLDIVVLVDISASVGDNTNRMESAVYSLIDKLRDGDEVRVIPICNGSYSTVTSPLDLKVPERREAFDEELVRSRSQFKKQVEIILSATPCKKTAILEAIERAAGLSRRGEETLYIYTDGIEDADISFYKDRRLGSSEEAVKLAEKLALVHRHLPDTGIRFGLLESEDFDKLPRQRRDAIVAFWRAYLSELNKNYQVETPELLREAQ
jgi:hypothetical protein